MQFQVFGTVVVILMSIILNSLNAFTFVEEKRNMMITVKKDMRQLVQVLELTVPSNLHICTFLKVPQVPENFQI